MGPGSLITHHRKKTMTSTTTPDFYTARELSKRWKTSEKTLERWRMEGTGPVYLKIGGRVLYGVGQIQEHERERVRVATGRSLPSGTTTDVRETADVRPW